MNFDKLNPFNRSKNKIENTGVESPKGGDIAPVVSEETKPQESKPRLSLEQELARIEEKKKEIEELIKSREDYYINAKNFEEKILMSGVSEDKAKAIRANVLEGAKEISEQINSIRKEYGIEATPVEMYSGRLNMILNEIKRIEENMAPKYREVKGIIGSYYGSNKEKTSQVMHQTHHIDIFEKSLDRFKSIPEVGQYLDKVQKMHIIDDKDKIAEAIDQLRDTIEEGIQKNTTYKTPGELRDAQMRIERLIALEDHTIKMLREAENKEGRFAK